MRFVKEAEPEPPEVVIVKFPLLSAGLGKAGLELKPKVPSPPTAVFLMTMLPWAVLVNVQLALLPTGTTREPLEVATLPQLTALSVKPVVPPTSVMV